MSIQPQVQYVFQKYPLIIGYHPVTGRAVIATSEEHEAELTQANSSVVVASLPHGAAMADSVAAALQVGPATETNDVELALIQATNPPTFGRRRAEREARYQAKLAAAKPSGVLHVVQD